MSHEVWGDQPPALAKALDAGLDLAPNGDRLIAAYFAARQALLDAALTSAIRHELLKPAAPCRTPSPTWSQRAAMDLRFQPTSWRPK